MPEALFFLTPLEATDSIHALEIRQREEGLTYAYNSSCVFPPVRGSLLRGERVDYLSEFTRAVRGDVRLDRRRHAARVQLLAGTKALKTQSLHSAFGYRKPSILYPGKGVAKDVV